MHARQSFGVGMQVPGQRTDVRTTNQSISQLRARRDRVELFDPLDALPRNLWVLFERPS